MSIGPGKYSSLTEVGVAGFIGVLWKKQVANDPKRPPTDLAFSIITL